MTDQATTTPRAAATWLDGLLLGAGTFLAIPVPAPTLVDRRAGAVAVLSAPLWGAVVGLAAALGGAAVWWLATVRGTASPGLALLAAGVVFAATALLTRGLHLDGLADTADGLGSGRTGAAGLAVMRQPAVGAFAVVTLLSTAGLQVAAVAAMLTGSAGITGMMVAVVAAAVLARTPLAWLARAGTAADDGGLGRTVVGSVAPRRAAVAVGGWSVVVGAGLLVGGFTWAGIIAALVATWLPALWLRRRTLARFGVITGDVLGATVELAATGVLVVLALVG